MHHDDKTMTMPKRRTGPREPRTESLAIRVSKKELALLEAAAGREGLKLREWMRDRLLQSAQKHEEDLLLSELTGLNMLLQDSLRSIHGALGLSVPAFNAQLLNIRDRKHVEAEALKRKREAPLSACDPEATVYVA